MLTVDNLTHTPYPTRSRYINSFTYLQGVLEQKRNFICTFRVDEQSLGAWGMVRIYFLHDEAPVEITEHVANILDYGCCGEGIFVSPQHRYSIPGMVGRLLFDNVSKFYAAWL